MSLLTSLNLMMLIAFMVLGSPLLIIVCLLVKQDTNHYLALYFAMIAFPPKAKMCIGIGRISSHGLKALSTICYPLSTIPYPLSMTMLF